MIHINIQISVIRGVAKKQKGWSDPHDTFIKPPFLVISQKSQLEKRENLNF